MLSCAEFNVGAEYERDRRLTLNFSEAIESVAEVAILAL